MQVNSYNKPRIPFQSNLPQVCKEAASTVGKTVGLEAKELKALQNDLNTTNVPRLKKELGPILDVFSNEATVISDRIVNNPTIQRIITGQNKQGQIASVAANKLNILR